MRHEVHTEVRGRHRVGLVGAEPVAQAQDQLAQPLREVRDRRRLALAEVLARLVVVAVDDDAAVRHHGVRAPGRDEVLAVQEDVVVAVVAHEAHERRLEVEALDVAGPRHARLGRADVEAHVRVGDGLLDLALRRREAAHIDDRVVGMLGIHGSSPWFGSARMNADSRRCGVFTLRSCRSFS